MKITELPDSDMSATPQTRPRSLGELIEALDKFRQAFVSDVEEWAPAELDLAAGVICAGLVSIDGPERRLLMRSDRTIRLLRDAKLLLKWYASQRCGDPLIDQDAQRVAERIERLLREVGD